MKPELDALAAQYPSKILVKYLIDMLDAGQEKGDAQGALVGRVQAKALKEWIGEGQNKDKRRMVVVCGPEQ